MSNLTVYTSTYFRAAATKIEKKIIKLNTENC